MINKRRYSEKWLNIFAWTAPNGEKIYHDEFVAGVFEQIFYINLK